MRGGLRLSPWGAIALVAGLMVPALGSDLSKFLHAVFDSQSGRPPTGAEVHYYSSVSRTDGPLESMARIMASTDYYVRQCQQRPELFVTRLYEVFVHREPTFEEQRYWAGRFPGGGVDARLAYIRQFCQANNIVDYVPGAPGAVPLPARPAGTQAEIAATLAAKATVLNSTIQRELAGTRYGRDLTAQAAVLVSASTQYRDTVNSPQSTPQQVAIAANNAVRACQELQATFRSVPGASAACQNLFWEVSQWVAAIESSAPATASTPGGATAVAAEASQLLALLRQFTTVLSTYQPQNAFYVSLYRDVNALAVQAESLELLARTGTGPQDVQRVTTSLLAQSRNIARQVGQADAGLQRGWWNVQHELDQLALAAGGSRSRASPRTTLPRLGSAGPGSTSGSPRAMRPWCSAGNAC